MATASQALQNYAEPFAHIVKSGAGREPAWLRTLRQSGFDRFNETGFPTTHDEDWRFTNISAIAQTNFQLNGAGNRVPTSRQIEPFGVAGAACQLVFVDGRFSPALSSLAKLPAGVAVSSLAAVIAGTP